MQYSESKRKKESLWLLISSAAHNVVWTVIVCIQMSWHFFLRYEFICQIGKEKKTDAGFESK